MKRNKMSGKAEQERHCYGDNYSGASDIFTHQVILLNGFGGHDTFFSQQFLQFAAFVHFPHDVAAANEFALDIEHWQGRPICEFFQAVSQLAVRSSVDVLERHAEPGKYLDDGRRRAALRKYCASIHIKHYFTRSNVLSYPVEYYVFHSLDPDPTYSGTMVWMAREWSSPSILPSRTL